MFAFKVNKNGKVATWIVDAKNGRGSVERYFLPPSFPFHSLLHFTPSSLSYLPLKVKHIKLFLCSSSREGKTKADVTLTLSDSDLFDLMSGKMNAQKAFFAGKLKIHGNMGMAMKLQEFQKQAQEKFATSKL